MEQLGDLVLVLSIPLVGVVQQQHGYPVSELLCCHLSSRVRGWSAGIGKGLREQVDSLLRGQENQQVNGERPGALQSAAVFASGAT
jgi:hypothetical protein